LFGVVITSLEARIIITTSLNYYAIAYLLYCAGSFKLTNIIKDIYYPVNIIKDITTCVANGGRRPRDLGLGGAPTHLAVFKKRALSRNSV